MKFRVYLKPFNDAGNYVSDYIEVTEDVISMGDISWLSDNTDYDVGIFRNAGFNIVMRNDKARYSEAGHYLSIF